MHPNDLQKLAIAAYNMGPTALRKLVKKHKTLSYDKLKKHLPKITRELVDFAYSNKPNEGGVEMYEPLVQAAFKLQDELKSDIDLNALSAHIYKESYNPKTKKKYDPTVKGPTQDVGIGQFTPITIKEFKRKGWLTNEKDITNPDKASELVLRYYDDIMSGLNELGNEMKIPKYQKGKSVFGYEVDPGQIFNIKDYDQKNMLHDYMYSAVPLSHYNAGQAAGQPWTNYWNSKGPYGAPYNMQFYYRDMLDDYRDAPGNSPYTDNTQLQNNPILNNPMQQWDRIYLTLPSNPVIPNYTSGPKPQNATSGQTPMQQPNTLNLPNPTTAIGQLPAIMSQDRMGTNYNQTGLPNATPEDKDKTALNAVSTLQNLMTNSLGLNNSGVTASSFDAGSNGGSYDDAVAPYSDGLTNKIGSVNTSNADTSSFDESKTSPADAGIPWAAIGEKLKGIVGGIKPALPLLGGVAMTGLSMALNRMAKREDEQRSMYSAMANYMNNARTPVNKGMNSSMLPIAQKGMPIYNDPFLNFYRDLAIENDYGLPIDITSIASGWRDNPDGSMDIKDAYIKRGEGAEQMAQLTDFKPEEYNQFTHKANQMVTPPGTVLDIRDTKEGRTGKYYSGRFYEKRDIDPYQIFSSREEANKAINALPYSEGERRFNIMEVPNGYSVIQETKTHQVLKPGTIRTPEELAKVKAYMKEHGITLEDNELVYRTNAKNPHIIEVPDKYSMLTGTGKIRYKKVNGKLIPISEQEFNERTSKNVVSRTTRNLKGNEPLETLTNPMEVPKARGGGSVPVSSEGQFKYPGQIVNVPSNNITMQGVPFPILGIGDNGMSRIMMPNQDYNFPGANNVLEIPMMRYGGPAVKKYQSGEEVPKGEAPKETPSESTKTNILVIQEELPPNLVPTTSGDGYYDPSEIYDNQGQLKLAPGTITPVDDPLTGTGRGLVAGLIKGNLGAVAKKAVKNKVISKVKDIVGEDLKKELQNAAIDNTRVVRPLISDIAGYSLPTDLVENPYNPGSYVSPSQVNQESMGKFGGPRLDEKGRVVDLVPASGIIQPVDDPFTMAAVDGTLGMAAKGAGKQVVKVLSSEAAKGVREATYGMTKQAVKAATPKRAVPYLKVLSKFEKSGPDAMIEEAQKVLPGNALRRFNELILPGSTDSGFVLNISPGRRAARFNDKTHFVWSNTNKNRLMKQMGLSEEEAAAGVASNLDAIKSSIDRIGDIKPGGILTDANLSTDSYTFLLNPRQGQRQLLGRAAADASPIDVDSFIPMDLGASQPLNTMGNTFYKFLDKARKRMEGASEKELLDEATKNTNQFLQSVTDRFSKETGIDLTGRFTPGMGTGPQFTETLMENNTSFIGGQVPRIGYYKRGQSWRDFLGNTAERNRDRVRKVVPSREDLTPNIQGKALPNETNTQLSFLGSDAPSNPTQYNVNILQDAIGELGENHARRGEFTQRLQELQQNLGKKQRLTLDHPEFERLVSDVGDEVNLLEFERAAARNSTEPMNLNLYPDDMALVRTDPDINFDFTNTGELDRFLQTPGFVNARAQDARAYSSQALEYMARYPEGEQLTRWIQRHNEIGQINNIPERSAAYRQLMLDLMEDLDIPDPTNPNHFKRGGKIPMFNMKQWKYPGQVVPKAQKGILITKRPPEMEALATVIKNRNRQHPDIQRINDPSAPYRLDSMGNKQTHLMANGFNSVWATLQPTNASIGPNTVVPRIGPIIPMPSMKVANYMATQGLIRH